MPALAQKILYAEEWDGIKKLNCSVELISRGKGFCSIQENSLVFTG